MVATSLASSWLGAVVQIIRMCFVQQFTRFHNELTVNILAIFLIGDKQKLTIIINEFKFYCFAY